MENDIEDHGKRPAQAGDPESAGDAMPPQAAPPGPQPPRRQVPAGARRTPSSSARRKKALSSDEQVEAWRARQATRAVPHPEYRQDAPRPQRPPRPQPKTPRAAGGPGSTPGVPASGGPRPASGSGPAPAGRTRDDARKAVRDASAGLRDSAERAGEAGAAFLAGIGESEGAARAKGFLTEDAPNWARRRGKQAAAAVGAMDPALRRKVVIIGGAILLYFIVMVHFSSHFYPGSTIGSVDISGMDVAQAAEAVGAAAGDYELQVEGDNGESFTVMSHEAGLTLDAEGMARQAMADNPGITWPFQLLLPHDHSDVIVASADAGGFREKVSDAVAWYNETAESPQDATISYDEDSHSFQIVPETRGNMLDEDRIVEHVSQALAVMQPTLHLGDDDYVHPSVYSDDERLKEALAQAEKALSTNVTFQAHDSDVATLDGNTAAKWVQTDENVQIVLDEDQVNTWVQDLVDKSSTVGAQRTWTREDGVECTVEGGDYGWEADWLAVDEAVHDAVLDGKDEKVDVPMLNEAAVYNGEHGRDWKSYIDVDLDSQHAVYYDDDGKVLWEADFVSGTPDGKHDTPQGVYYIKNKESPSLLVGDANATGSPEYQTTVQYWIPWRGNDVGFHDATWQEAFGGTRYLDGYGSHGCINLSSEAAAQLYQLVPVGAVVVCHGSGTEKVAADDDDGNGQDSDGDGLSDAGSAGELDGDAPYVEEAAYAGGAVYGDTGYDADGGYGE